MHDVDADVRIADQSVAEAEHEADGVQVPLYFLELDAAFSQRVAHENVDHNDAEQDYPNPRDGVADPRDDGIDGLGECRAGQFRLTVLCHLRASAGYALEVARQVRELLPARVGLPELALGCVDGAEVLVASRFFREHFRE